MKNKYCPAGKTECEHFNNYTPGLSGFNCTALSSNEIPAFEFNTNLIQQCPWPSRIDAPIEEKDKTPIEKFCKELLAYQGTDKIMDATLYRKMKELYLKHFFEKDL